MNQRIPALIGAACLGLSLGVASSHAQSSETGGAGQTASPAGQMNGKGAGGASNADKKFVQKAMAGGMAEVQLGQLATQKAGGDDVKQFGQKMVDDHTRLNEQMKPIATQLGITPPASLPPAEQSLQTKLEGLSGNAFDKAYMQAMVKDHRKDLAEFKKEASSGKATEVKDAAQQGEQVISQHLQLAEQIVAKHNWETKGIPQDDKNPPVR